MGETITEIHWKYRGYEIWATRDTFLGGPHSDIWTWYAEAPDNMPDIDGDSEGGELGDSSRDVKFNIQMVVDKQIGRATK